MPFWQHLQNSLKENLRHGSYHHHPSLQSLLAAPQHRRSHDKPEQTNVLTETRFDAVLTHSTDEGSLVLPPLADNTRRSGASSSGLAIE